MKLSSREIIQEAWDFTQGNKKLILVYAFIPALLSTAVGIFYLGYQYYAFLSSPLFEDWNESFLQVLSKAVLGFLQENFWQTWPFIIVIAILGILYLLIPSICEGSIIQLIARKRNGQKVRTRDGLSYGFLNFLPVFEYSWVSRTFSLASLLTWSAFILRNLGPDALNALFFVVVFFLIVSLIMTLLFTYTNFFIVIDGKGVIESIGASSRLVVAHLEKTLLLSVLMLIIGVRIVVQALFVLLIPGIMIGILYLFTGGALPFVALIVAGAVGLILLYIASYLSATLHVFAASVWTFTFLELTKEDEVSARESAESA